MIALVRRLAPLVLLACTLLAAPAAAQQAQVQTTWRLLDYIAVDYPEAVRGGRIVNVTSVHEHVPLRGSAAYCAAKGGLGLLTKVMALELAEHGITVNAIAPGEIATPMTGAEDVDPGGEDRPAIPLGRPGHADEIAAAIAFLAGSGGSYATGASFVVDGGMLLMAAVANQDA